MYFYIYCFEENIHEKWQTWQLKAMGPWHHGVTWQLGSVDLISAAIGGF